MTGIKTQVYAGRIKDEDVLMASSSGGAFTAISDFFLEKGNAVVAAGYNYQTYTEEYQLIQNVEERNVARGSKYMQSKPGDVFKKAEIWLQQNPGKEILFVGMGCQAEGFRKFMEIKGLRDRVYIVDIICHGSPSPKLWREYAQSLEYKRGKIEYLTFKDKRKGWQTPTALVKINGKEITIYNYVKVFYNRCALRPSCHVCPFTTTERKTDMTIGDFWHIEETIPDFYDKKGNSVFLIHTFRGEELFNRIKDSLDYRESNVKQCWQKNLESPTLASEQRMEFWKDYHDKGIDYIMKKYGTTPLLTKVKNRAVKLLSIGGGANVNYHSLFHYVDSAERRAA